MIDIKTEYLIKHHRSISYPILITTFAGLNISMLCFTERECLFAVCTNEIYDTDNFVYSIKIAVGRKHVMSFTTGNSTLKNK